MVNKMGLFFVCIRTYVYMMYVCMYANPHPAPSFQSPQTFFWNHPLNLGVGAGLGWAGCRGWAAGLAWPGVGSAGDWARLRQRTGWLGWVGWRGWARAGWHCGLGWLGGALMPTNLIRYGGPGAVKVKCPRISLGMGVQGAEKDKMPTNLIRYGGPGGWKS